MIHSDDVTEKQIRRRRRGLLRMYYGVDEQESSEQPSDPMDIDEMGFKPDQYLEKLLKELSLVELFDKERQMKRGKMFRAC